MEIERKYLIEDCPKNLSDFPCRHLEQAYLCTEPVVRIRRDDDRYELTYKSKGLMIREEYNHPLTETAYLHLREKADGTIISKTRYLIPYETYTIELDVFEGTLAPLILAEVEFQTKAEALNFVPPSWFGEDVTLSSKYHNSNLSKMTMPN